MLIGSNLVCVAALVYAIAVQPALRNFLLFYSDNITLPMYFNSILAHNGAISGFHYGTQGFFFPGYPLYLLSYLIAFLVPGDQYAASLIVKAILQVVCFNFALYYLGRALFREGHRAALYSGVCTLFLTLILVLGQHLALEGWPPTVLFLTSTHHIGVAIGIPLFLAGAINYFHSRKMGNLYFIGALSAVIIPSTTTWIPWFIVPFVVALFLLFLLNMIDKKYFVRVTLCIALSAGVGYILNFVARQFFAVTNPSALEISRIPEGLSNLRLIIENVYLQSWPLIVALLLMAALCCVGIFYLCKTIYKVSRLKDGDTDRATYFPLMLILLYSLLAGIFILLIPVFIGRADILRYYSPLVVLSLFGILPFFYMRFRHKTGAYLTALTSLGIILIASPIYLSQTLPFNNPAILRQSDYVYQVAQKDLPGDFIGDFWTITSVGLYTDARVTHVNANGRMRPILQNIYDLDGASFQNLILLELDSNLIQILDRLPEYSSKFTFEAYTSSNVKVAMVIYHWEEPIDDYLRWFTR